MTNAPEQLPSRGIIESHRWDKRTGSPLLCALSGVCTLHGITQPSWLRSPCPRKAAGASLRLEIAALWTRYLDPCPSPVKIAREHETRAQDRSRYPPGSRHSRGYSPWIRGRGPVCHLFCHLRDIFAEEYSCSPAAAPSTKPAIGKAIPSSSPTSPGRNPCATIPKAHHRLRGKMGKRSPTGQVSRAG